MTLLLLFLTYAIALSAALAVRGHRSRPSSSGGASGPAPSRLLIIGATGGTGRQVVAQALERGFAVTALVRDPARLPIAHPQLTVVQGDVLDAGSVEAAMRGQEAVVSALGHKRFFSTARILSEGTRNVLRAMELHRVRRFVCERRSASATALGVSGCTTRSSRFRWSFRSTTGTRRARSG